MRSYADEIVRRLEQPPFRGNVRALGEINYKDARYPMVAVERVGDGAKPCILMAAGIHGNEAAGVWALFDFVERFMGAYEDRFDFILLPCMNPAGFEHEVRTNLNGIDLNRNFFSEAAEREVSIVKDYLRGLNKKFAASIELHEDPSDEPEAGFTVQDNPLGFYLYETAPAQQPLGALIISCLERGGIGIAANESIYGDRCERGVIRADDPTARRMGAFSEYLFQFTPRTLVLETPTLWPLEVRMSAHQQALSCVLESLARQNG